MARRPRWQRLWGRGRPDNVDPELVELFRSAPEPGDRARLLEAASEIRARLAAAPPPAADPGYRAHLRASLMAEARQHRLRSQQHPSRRFGIFFGAGLGAAGLAMVALVIFSIAAPERAGAVTVRASVGGNPRVPVTQAIQLSFNQPMVESRVEQGLVITPAVSYRTRWPDPKTLVIDPEHDLVPNVSYVVSIARQAARAQDGATALSNVVIPFGTEPLTATAQGYPPSLVAVNPVVSAVGALGLQYSENGELLLTASGSVVANGNTQAVGPSPSVPLPGPSAGAVYSISGQPAVLATDATNAVPSPDSQQIAYWTVTNSGTATLEVAPLGGQGQVSTLATVSGTSPDVVWINDSSLVYSSSGQLYQVNLDGQSNPVDPFVKLGPGQTFALAPQAQALFSRPAGVPTVWNLKTGSSVTVPGLEGSPQWSPTGSQLAYIGNSDGTDAIYLAGPYGSQPRALLVTSQGVTLSDLRYSPGGQYLTYLAATPGVGVQAGAVDIATGSSALLSTTTGLSDLVWSPFGSSLAALEAQPSEGSMVVTLQLSVPPELSSSRSQASSALAVASDLAGLQVADTPSDSAAIGDLLAAGSSIPPATLQPGPFDRFYAVSSVPLSAAASTYQVEIELVRDATAKDPAAAQDEQVTVDVSGPEPLISGVFLGSLTPLPVGPLVIGATATGAPGGSVSFALQFNSDLDPITVGAQSISLQDSGQTVANLQIAYQAANRMVTVVTGPLPPGPLSLTVQAPLANVDHVQIAVPYTLSLPTVPAPVPGS